MSDEQLPRSTKFLETSGSPPNSESVARVREALEAVKDADPDERDEHVKTALGETIDLKAAGVMHAPEVEENLMSILTRPDEETGFFANQALRELETVQEEVESDAETDAEADAADDEDAPLDATTEESEPPECVRWTGENWGVIEVEASRPFIEWLALEADEAGQESLGWFITLILQNWLEEDLVDDHRFEQPVKVDVPPDVAQRVALKHADYELRGIERDPEQMLFDYSAYNITLTLDGDPWALADDAEGDEDA